MKKKLDVYKHHNIIKYTWTNEQKNLMALCLSQRIYKSLTLTAIPLAGLPWRRANNDMETVTREPIKVMSWTLWFVCCPWIFNQPAHYLNTSTTHWKNISLFSWPYLWWKQFRAIFSTAWYKHEAMFTNQDCLLKATFVKISFSVIGVSTNLMNSNICYDFLCY